MKKQSQCYPSICKQQSGKFRVLRIYVSYNQSSMACDGCACGNVAEQIDQAQKLQPKDCLEVDDEAARRNKALQSTGAQLIDGDFVRGIRVAGWSILTRKAPILKMGPREK